MPALAANGDLRSHCPTTNTPILDEWSATRNAWRSQPSWHYFLIPVIQTQTHRAPVIGTPRGVGLDTFATSPQDRPRAARAMDRDTRFRAISG